MIGQPGRIRPTSVSNYLSQGRPIDREPAGGRSSLHRAIRRPALRWSRSGSGRPRTRGCWERQAPGAASSDDAAQQVTKRGSAVSLLPTGNLRKRPTGTANLTPRLFPIVKDSKMPRPGVVPTRPLEHADSVPGQIKRLRPCCFHEEGAWLRTVHLIEVDLVMADDAAGLGVQNYGSTSITTFPSHRVGRLGDEHASSL